MKRLTLILTLFVSIFCSNSTVFAENTTTQKTQALLLQKLQTQAQDLKAQVQAMPTQQTKSSQTVKVQFKKLNTAFLTFFRNLGTTFKYVVDKCDKLTSKKFIISALIIIGPAITAYCKFFDPELLHKIFKKHAEIATEGAMHGGSAIAEGVVEGVIQGAKENPNTVLKVGGIWLGAKIALKTADEIAKKVSGIVIATLPHLYRFFRNRSRISIATQI